MSDQPEHQHGPFAYGGKGHAQCLGCGQTEGDVGRFAKDAADVQTRRLAAEARAERAEATVRRVEALADRLDARFLHEDADAIRRVLAEPTEGGSGG